ncbi:MAG: glycosyltransferase [archaeon]
MKIAFSPARVWDSTWGQEKNLVEVLAKKHEVRIIDLVDYDNRYSQKGMKYGVPKNATIVRRGTSLKPGILLGMYSEMENLSALVNMRFDVFVLYSTLGNVLASLYAKITGRRVVLIYADDLGELFAKKSRIGGWLTSHIFTPAIARLADHVVTTAHKLKSDMEKYNSRVSYIPNGVDLKRLKKGKDKHKRFTIGFVGGFGEWVDFDLVIKLAKEVDADFVLIGGGPLLGYVKDKAKDLPNVTVTGILPYEKAMKEISKAHVSIIPFRVNRLTDRVSPIKLFEYWGLGLPVISTPFYEAEKAGEGIVEFAETAKYFKKAIERMRDKAHRDEVAAKGLAKVKENDWAELGKRYLEII